MKKAPTDWCMQFCVNDFKFDCFKFFLQCFSSKFQIFLLDIICKIYLLSLAFIFKFCYMIITIINIIVIIIILLVSCFDLFNLFIYIYKYFNKSNILFQLKYLVEKKEENKMNNNYLFIFYIVIITCFWRPFNYLWYCLWYFWLYTNLLSMIFFV